MDEQQEQIHKDMEKTRASLERKVGALENQVAQTVGEAAEVIETAREAVTQTIEGVKGAVESVSTTVQETASTVGRTLNLRLQTERHPWLVLCGSMTLGCCVALWIHRPRRDWLAVEPVEPQPAPEPPPALAPRNVAAPLERRDMPWPHGEHAAPPAPPVPEARGFLSEEVGKLKSLALGTFLGVVRDVLRKQLPPALGKGIGEQIDSMTRKLGGEPIRDDLTQSQPAADKPRPAGPTAHNGGHKKGPRPDRMREGPPPRK
jgi:hypothetical protein